MQEKNKRKKVTISLYDKDIAALEAGFALVPDGYGETVIDGGNHAQFGSYGQQKGDGEATIPAAEQWQITADAILETVNSY